MVGDHAEPDVVLALGAVRLAGQLLGARDHGVDDVDLVHVLLALQQQRDTVQAHAGVDVLLRQGAGDVEVGLGAHGAEVVLHEDEVPDLQEPVLELDGHVRAERGRVEVGTEVRTAVEEDLRARAAGTRDAHRPVVLLRAELDDPLARQPGDPRPELDGLVVADQHGGVQPVPVQPVAALGYRLGDQVPGELDRAFLEVVAEGEVAAHLEERGVPRRLADVLDVGGADALLHARGAVEGRCLLAEEVGLERHHAGVDEQQVGVVGEGRCGGHHGVSGGLEVREESAADLGGVHQWSFCVSVCASVAVSSGSP